MKGTKELIGISPAIVCACHLIWLGATRAIVQLD